MTMPGDKSDYRGANVLLAQALAAYEASGNLDLEHVIAVCGPLSPPSGSHETDEFSKCGIGATIAMLAQRLSMRARRPRGRVTDPADTTIRQLELLWDATRSLAPHMGVRSLATWILSIIAVEPRAGSLILDVARAAEEGGLSAGEFLWGRNEMVVRDSLAGAIAKILTRTDGRRVEEALRLAASIGVSFTNNDWRRFIDLAARRRGIDIPERIRTACSDREAPAAESAWRKLISLAIECSDAALVEQLWMTRSMAPIPLHPSEWVWFARAAGEFAGHELLREVWSKWRSSGVELDPRGWRAFVVAGGVVGRGDFVEEIWGTWQEKGPMLDGPSLGVLAGAAAGTNRANVLRAVWSECKRPRSSSDGRHASNSAVAEVESVSFGSRTWGAIAAAAGKTGDGILLQDVWQTWRQSGDALDPSGWFAFARAADNSEQGDLVEEIWRAWQADGPPLDAATLGIVARAAGRTNRGSVLHEVWSACKQLTRLRLRPTSYREQEATS